MNEKPSPAALWYQAQDQGGTDEDRRARYVAPMIEHGYIIDYDPGGAAEPMNREQIADVLMDAWWDGFIGGYPGLLSSAGNDRDKWRAWLDWYDWHDSWAVGRIRSARALTIVQADALVAAGCVPSDALTQAERAVAWHEKRFPDAEPALVALKGCEEMGEVASAVLGEIGTTSATGKGDVLSECADVVIALMVLLGRWWPFSADLHAAVDAKLKMLENPDSDHPAALARGVSATPEAET